VSEGLDLLFVVPGRGKEAKLKVVLCQYFKYRCQRNVMKKSKKKKSSEISPLSLCQKGMKAN
jgi:hypothetical protein